MDINKNIIQSEADKLGAPASHGCIRLSVEDAYWFYNIIPAGAGLLIQN
jgi:lipoprotein-anchoring transpeptidase ErfK/SrfK